MHNAEIDGENSEEFFIDRRGYKNRGDATYISFSVWCSHVFIAPSLNSLFIYSSVFP